MPIQIKDAKFNLTVGLTALAMSGCSTLPAPVTAPVTGRVTFAADVFFDPQSEALVPGAKEKLDDLYDKIEKRGIVLETVIAVGHTDSVGEEDANKRLAQARADATKAYLVSKGVESNLVYAEGKGETQFVGDNNTHESRAKQNRVEVEVVGRRPRDDGSKPEAMEPKDVIPVLFATNRARTTSDNPFSFYSNKLIQQADQNNLRRGVAVIRLPKNRIPGTVSRPTWVKVTISRLASSAPAAAVGIAPRPAADPETEFSYADAIEELSARDFSKELSVAVSNSSSKTALLYVHGYANDFTDAVFRTAQLVVDLERPGYDLVPIMFSWPSNPGLFGLNYDEASKRVRKSGHDLARFVEELLNATDVGTIHLVAHSMGSDVLGYALLMLGADDKLAHGTSSNRTPRFRQVVFAAPDVDLEIFSDIVKPVIRSAHRVTTYGATTDLPLWWSEFENKKERTGSVRASDWLPDCVDTIDVTQVASKGLAHSTWAEEPRVIDDLRLMLRFGLGPEQRGLEMRRMVDRTIWRMPMLAPAPTTMVQSSPPATARVSCGRR